MENEKKNTAEIIWTFLWGGRGVWGRVLMALLAACGVTIGTLQINGVNILDEPEMEVVTEPQINVIEPPVHNHADLENSIKEFKDIEQSSTELTSIKDEINVLKEELPKLQQHVNKFKQDIERAEGKIDDHLYVDHEQ